MLLEKCLGLIRVPCLRTKPEEEHSVFVIQQNVTSPPKPLVSSLIKSVKEKKNIAYQSKKRNKKGNPVNENNLVNQLKKEKYCKPVKEKKKMSNQSMKNKMVNKSKKKIEKYCKPVKEKKNTVSQSKNRKIL